MPKAPTLSPNVSAPAQESVPAETVAGDPPPSAASPKAPVSLEDSRGRKAHPGLKVVEDPNSENYGEPTAKLSAVPEDYNADTHQPLKKKNFADEAVYFDFRAMQADAEAAVWREKAATYRKFGDAEQRKQALKFKALSSKIAELKEQLAASGIDVGDLLDEEEAAALTDVAEEAKEGSAS